MGGLFITFEGTEGAGKSTQIQLLAERLRNAGKSVRILREPGGTPIGEEIRHTLKHSEANRTMLAETELLLMAASRAQLTREVIRPALAAGEIVLCDRFSDSTMAYQGYGRGLDMEFVKSIIAFAAGGLTPDLTFLLMIPLSMSEARRAARADTMRDRFDEAGRHFFQEVERGYRAFAAAEPQRIQLIDGRGEIAAVQELIWSAVQRHVR
jgi:dTMP kinase